MRKTLTSLFLFVAIASQAAMISGRSLSLKLDLLKVFYASKSDNLTSIVRSNTTVQNTDNLADAHPSNIYVQNTKYSIVYSIDETKNGWSAVVNEWPSYNQDVPKRYSEFVNLLKEALSTENGWNSFQLKMNKSDELSDIVYKKAGYGYVVLDYTKNADGKCSIQLRVTPKVDSLNEISEEISQLNQTVMSK